MIHSNKSSLRSFMVVSSVAIICSISMFLFTGCAAKAADDQTMSVVAHRGGAALAPENTIAAFTVALEHDVDAVELDIHMSKDGSLMVIHDPLLLRLTGKPGAISDYTEQELEQFDVAATFKGGKHYFGFQKMPTLAEVIEFIEGNATRPIQYQIEIMVKEDGSRYEGIEQKLIDTLHKYAILDRSMAISFDFPTLVLLKGLEPNLQLGALISKDYLSSKGITGPEKVAKNMQELNVDTVGIKSDYLSQALYDQLRAYDLGVGVWTVDDTINMRKFVNMGVDYITTNRPDLLNKVLDRKVKTTVSSSNSDWYL